MIYGNSITLQSTHSWEWCEKVYRRFKFSDDAIQYQQNDDVLFIQQYLCNML